VVSEVADRVVVMYAGRVMESGSADDLLTRPAHPYTEALLRSVPQVEQLGQELYAIPGSPPSPANQPDGCAFHPRCARLIERCRTERPHLTLVSGSRSAACHLAEEVLDAAVIG
jgi:oligopeptide transport system ATP-binding protein